MLYSTQGDCEAAVSEHNGGNSLSSTGSVLLSSNVSTCTSTVARVPNPSLVDTVNLSERHHTPIAGVAVPLQDGGSSSTGQSPPVSIYIIAPS